MDDDWDLHAVVRSCTTSNTNTNTITTFNHQQQDCNFLSSSVQDPIDTRRGSFIEDLHDLYKPFFPQQKSQQLTTPLTSSSQNLVPISPLSVLGGLQDLSSEQIVKQQKTVVFNNNQRQQPFSVVVNGSKPLGVNPSSRSKRRKNNFKKVCHVPAEGLSSDMWSWRKYGQKPIKGSPYPRGYYKCSTSKGCLARKQVERNRSDPGMFIVTYTAEHNHPMPTHRNSLAGSTRLKSEETDDPKKPSSPEKLESSHEELPEAEDEDDDINVAMDDDFFEGLEDFAGVEAGECFFDNIPASLPIAGSTG